MFKYNRDVKLRDSMLHWNEELDKIWKSCDKKGDYEKNYSTRYFNQLDVSTLEKLIDLKFADPRERQNDAPCIGEFLDWMRKNPDYKAHGYAVSIERADYRISIEGVDGCAKTQESLIEFVNMFHDADEFDVEKDYQRAWYD